MKPALQPASAPKLAHRLLRLLPCLLLFLIFATPLPAQATSTGSVTGVVTDPRGAFLQGAEVRIEGTPLVTTTDRTGRYRIDGVPAGTQRVRANYLGFGEAATTVNVTPGVTVTASLSYAEDMVVLDQFVVESIVEGQARALNQQRASDTIKNIVAADRLGELPDASVAEALARLPGIAVQKDLGEPRFITVRGTSADQNAVSLNGDRLTSTGDPTESRDNRAVSLHTLPVEMLSGIEVTKALTPDMDADALGGNVNLLTKSSLELERRILSGRIEGGYNDIRSSYSRAFSLTYGDRLANGKIGYLVSGSTQNSERGLDSTTFSYLSRTIDGQLYTDLINELQIRHRFLTRTRDMISGQVDFKTGENSTHYLRGLATQSDDVEQRRRLRVGFGTDSRFLPGTNNTTAIVDGGRIRREDRDGFKRTNIYNAGFGGRWEMERYTLDYNLAYTWNSFKVRRAVIESDYRLRDFTNAQGVRLDLDNVPDLTYDRTNTDRPAITDPLNHFSNYGRFRISNYMYLDHDMVEEDLNGSVNLRLPSQLGQRPVEWKFGLRYRTKDKDHRPESPSFSQFGQPTLTTADFLNPNIRAEIFGGQYAAGPTNDPVLAREFFRNNPDRFSLNAASVRNNQAATYDATEDIHGAYAMATTDIEKLRLVGGVRWERTRNAYNAVQQNFGPTGAFLGFTPISAKASYDNFFPSLVATYRVKPDLLVRAAWTNTIARANYNDLVPARTENDQTDTITEGNTALKPLLSRNYDLSVEWYLQSAGIVSAGVFHKDIRNFAFRTTRTIVGGPYDGWFLNRPENGPTGSITGIELAWVQPFRFLPAPFDGFGIQANYSAFDAEGEYPGRGKLGFLPGQVNKVYNAQIYYEKHGFSARVAYNVNGRFLDAIGGSDLTDVWLDRSPNWDASLGYRVRPGWRVYLEGRNLTDADKKRTYQGRPDRPIETEYAGWSVTAGLRFEL
jgi:TonB-dependent receptor